jgi:hypothetical protein
MEAKSRKAVHATAIALAAAMAIGVSAQVAAAQGGRTIEQQFKNIQVLKGEPADMLNPTMVYFEAALGVGCPFCHDPDGSKRDADTNERKLTARRMIQMVNNINQTTFGGQKVVNCMTCHQGRNKPIGVPFVVTDQAPPALGEAYLDSLPGPAPIPNVTVDQIFSKYVTAVGGADALQKVPSLTARGEMIQRRPARDFPAVPLEISAKGPAKQLIVSGSGQNADKLAYSGSTGWTGNRDLRRAELDGKRLEDAFNIATQLKDVLVNPKVDHPEVVNGRELYVVSARTQALPLVKLYFEKDSGLLTRLVYHTDSIFGPYPTQIEYRDYRNVNGRKVPHTWVIAGTRNREYTYVMRNVQAAAVDDGVFAKPARQ